VSSEQQIDALATELLRRFGWGAFEPALIKGGWKFIAEAVAPFIEQARQGERERIVKSLSVPGDEFVTPAQAKVQRILDLCPPDEWQKVVDRDVTTQVNIARDICTAIGRVLESEESGGA
jgi:hypothetical protein